jgi:hypothetical protein
MDKRLVCLDRYMRTIDIAPRGTGLYCTPLAVCCASDSIVLFFWVKRRRKNRKK